MNKPMTTNQEPPPIKGGDLLYAVGPGHNPPHDVADLRVYCTPVVAIRQLGSYSKDAPPELVASGQFSIELDNDRPVLGFPKYFYGGHEIGISIHRSRPAALQAFKEQAHQSINAAQDALAVAHAKIQWTLAEESLNPANSDGWCLAAENHTYSFTDNSAVVITGGSGQRRHAKSAARIPVTPYTRPSISRSETPTDKIRNSSARTS